MAQIELKQQLKSAPSGYYVVNLNNMLLECFSSIDDVHNKKGLHPLFALSSDNEVFLDGVAVNPYFLDDYRLMICTFGLLQFLSKFPTARNSTTSNSNGPSGILMDLADQYVNVLSDSITGRLFKSSPACSSMPDAIKIFEAGLHGRDLDAHRFWVAEVPIFKAITGIIADLLRWKNCPVGDTSHSIKDAVNMLKKDASTPFLLT